MPYIQYSVPKIRSAILYFIHNTLYLIPYTLYLILGTALPAHAKQLDNPVKANNLVGLVGILVNSFFAIIGAAALTFIIIGGFLMVTAAGDEEKVERGKNILLYTAVGVGLLFMVYVVIKYVIVVFTGQ
ncbi:hypothetical protein HZA86_02595 [Candidatus Uhrbacteria bacterium]|nr:hypothetical protein [Candidatus Uhrbacteria bacterium]